MTSDIKSIDRLEDWFDGAVVLGALPSWAGALAARMAIVRPAPATALESLQAELRQAGIKRPLVLALDDDAAGLCAAWDEPFKACAMDAPDALAKACDSQLPLENGPEAWEATVVDLIRQRLDALKRLNVLILYHDGYTHIECTREHLTGFANRSRHKAFFLHADETRVRGDPNEGMFQDYGTAWPQAFDFDVFDAVVWHYTLPAYRRAPKYEGDFLSEIIVDRLAAYDGLKVLFVQDEYDNTATTWAALRRAGIQLVMTVVPEPYVRYAYPQAETPGVEFISTLTGFVPDSANVLERYSRPLSERPLRLAYRGRVLPARYGELAREKAMIGTRMRELTLAHGVAADIEISEDKRIYGEDWYRFLASSRATLATESGSNVFDFDGSLAEAETAGEMAYEDFQTLHDLPAREGRVRMNQISSKVFEAIALRTALVCFEGGYSGVIQPWDHFIPLKKDFSNVGEVFAMLEDVPALEAMTERAHRDVIRSGRYSYQAFAERFDRILETRVARPPRAQIISAPIAVRRRGGFNGVTRKRPFEFLLTDCVLGGDFRHRQLEDVMADVMEAQSSPGRRHADRPPADARVVWRAGPEAVKCFEFWRNAGASLEVTDEGARIATPPVAWHYSQGVNLDFADIDFERDHVWVRLEVAQVEGALLVSLHDADNNLLAEEAALPEGRGPVSLYLKARDAAKTMLLLRTGERDEQARALILGVQIIAASVYLPQVSALLAPPR
jgi:hypothetical protein